MDLELQKLEKQDIIEKVPDTEHTDWVSPIVVVPKKDGRIRMCVDMRAANTAIKQIRHPIPTVKDISMELTGAKFFSKLDMSQAYHHLQLSPESRGVTTFTTHAGLYRYKRLTYGTKSAAEICGQGIHDNNLTKWVPFCFKGDFGTLWPGEQK